MSVIEIKNLSKRYQKVLALDNLSLNVDQGEILGYLGPNGSGKTTTIKLMLNLIKPTSGQISIFGKDAAVESSLIHQDLAYVPGEASLWPFLTGEETLYLLEKIHGKSDHQYRDELIKKFALEPNKKVRSLSKGNKQKITLIAALSSRAKLLILDEPTAGLDPLMEQTFREEVRKAKNNGQTIFLSSHILGEVEALCDQIAVLRSGKLVEAGSLEELRHLSAVTVEATFSAQPPDIKGVKGVSSIVIHGHHLECQVNGPIEELFKVIVKAKPLTFLCREPSLEELFLSLYGDNRVNKK